MIKLKNISKYYYSKGMISSGISKVNLQLDKGEFVVITGESGSGKTTLLNVISGLDSYEEGEMYIDGQETSHYQAPEFEDYRKRYIGNIFQDFNLINSYTVYQNVELTLLINGYSRQEIKERAPRIIEKVGLTPYAKTKVSKLSGGQKQRTAIARALAKDTDIIVADEPTGNLDSVSAEGIVRLLSEISKDKLVIVVTHNYEQFAPYATRKIKMHDGKVAEDIQQQTVTTFRPSQGVVNGKAVDETVAPLASLNSAPSTALNKRHQDKDITAAGKIKLGIRNTFNILPKFVLLLIVFLFVVVAVASQYTTFRHQDAEEAKLGYNDYFYNYSEDRVVLKKVDDSEFTADDLKVMRNVPNVRSVVLNDIMLDTWLYIEDKEFSYEAYPHSLEEFEGKLLEGRMPEAEKEAILAVNRDDYYFGEDMMGDTISRIMDKDCKITFTDDMEVTVRIVGFAYADGDTADAMHAGKLYITDDLLDSMRKEIYHSNSQVSIGLNGKELLYETGSFYCRVIPNKKVEKGNAVIFEEAHNFYGEQGAKGKEMTIAVENMYYTESIDLTISDVYDERTFRQLTGVNDYDYYNGSIYISPEDYDALFEKGNYQVTVYVKDMSGMDDTLGSLKNMGYVMLPLKDTLIAFADDIGGIIEVPVAILIIIVMFFIAYFVIRLILKSRAVYFGILRMLGMAKKSMRQILDVEMLLVGNIAYGIFLVFIALVKKEIIDIPYVFELVEYMGASDYAALYGIILVMAYLISGKFAKNMFRRTAMGTYREEGRMW